MADEYGFEKGDVLAVERNGGLYEHYGIYAGDGKIIHFSADDGSGVDETDPMKADIRETTIDGFSKGDPCYVDHQEEAGFSGDEIVNRARKMIGTQKGKYHLAYNNCEHFAKYCKTGSKLSDQVNSFKDTVGDIAFSGAEGLYDGYVMGIQDERQLLDATVKRISKKTNSIVDDYNHKAPEISNEEWIGSTLSGGKAYEAAYVDSYLKDVNHELDVYDGYRRHLSESIRNGMKPLEWFGKQFSSDDKFFDTGNPDFDKALTPGEKKELFIESFQTGTMYNLSKDMDEDLKKGEKSAVKTFLGGVDINNPEEVRNAKIVLATGLKKAASSVLHFEVPNSVTVPVASAGFDIGADITRCINKEINPLQCAGRCVGHVVTAGVHIIKRTVKSIVKDGLGLIGRGISNIATSFASNAVHKSPETKRIASSVVKTFGDHVKAGAKKIVNTIGKALGKVAGGIKKAGNAIAKAFGFGKRK